MIVYVDLEHVRLRDEPELWSYFGPKTLETKYRLEAISGELCLIVHYRRVTPAVLRELGTRAVVVGGNYTGWEHYTEADLAGIQAVLREAAWPTLTICGGLQLLARTYDAEIGPMDSQWVGSPELHPGTPTPPGVSGATSDTPAHDVTQERGFMPIRVLRPHSLFKGCGQPLVVFQLHSWEVKSTPEGFGVLAETDLCRVQAIAHESRPLFGTQFHPELYDEVHPDGWRILENFFKFIDRPPNNRKRR